MSDRVFAITFGISLGLHLLLVVGQLLSLNWFGPPSARRPIEVVYEYAAAKEELRRVQEQLARARRNTAASPSPSTQGERTQIRIPDRPSFLTDQTLLEAMPERTSVVDLTNLVDAARGDPVLLGYFGALREQIQRTANAHPWLSGESGEGLIYVSFRLSAGGAIQSADIVSDRSVASRALWNAALRIINTAAPFPPFPPSMMTESSKTIVVPLEFLVGPS